MKGKNPYGRDSVQQHVSQNLGAFIEPYMPYGHRTAATEILGTFFEVTVQHLIQDRSYCTTVLAQKSRVLFCNFFQSNSCTEFEEEISNLLVLIFADVISRIEEIRRTPSLSLVFPTLGFFQGRFDQNFVSFK